MSVSDERDYNGDGKVTPAEKKRFKKENSKEVLSNKWGFAYAIIKQDPQLERFFNREVAKYLKNPSGFSKEAFFLNLEKQPFSQKYSTAAIQDMNFEARYPDLYQQQIEGEVEDLRDVTLNMGAQLNDDELLKLVKDKRRLGLTDAQVSNRLAKDYLTVRDGRFSGAAGTKQDQLNQWAIKNSITLSQETVQNYVREIAMGNTTEDDVKNDLRRTYMAGAFPAWADRINAGQDIYDIANPYRSRMAALLELSEEEINFNDATLSKGLQGVGADGKPGVVPLYEFDKMVRKDPRWDRTENALKTYTDVGTNLLKMFGFR